MVSLKEEMTPYVEGSGEYVEQAVMDSRHGAILQVGV
jgi:hypothetical protein